jgi:cell division protein FtsQ
VIPIRDIEAVTPVAGTRIRSESLLNAVRVAAGLSDELRSVTRMISAPSVEKTALITHDEIQIYIGDVEGLEEKDRVARAILEKEKGKLVYINVRVASSPTWRGLD